ncbi:hypothetical protein FO497_22985 [Bacillus cereus ATCC 10876]|uniref:Peroxidase n=3 Tax=Bacillus cereus group TaxID=86661 RepID=A0AAW4HU31_BACTU|nr:hypothetical protein [Bacillus cereus]MBD8075308.1 hypothetical protein [Bacillus thuringiensis]MDR4131663.1 hypothetical protein [Bacillus cereus ATCC 10876]OTZ78409.1 hypothetical protein BK769_02890 [Bacillus thuringiensis serovar kumamtoensis]QQP82422.1 hypothetical protein JI729_17205 [Bacillus sp. TK-2]
MNGQKIKIFYLRINQIFLEKFILYNGGDNRIYVLQALSNGRYISANGGRELTATSYVAGSWERFVIVYF